MDLVWDDQATIYGVVGELNTKNMKQKDSYLIVGHTACIAQLKTLIVLWLPQIERGRDEYY